MKIQTINNIALWSAIVALLVIISVVEVRSLGRDKSALEMIGEEAEQINTNQEAILSIFKALNPND